MRTSPGAPSLAALVALFSAARFAETVNGMYLAREERFWDGFALATGTPQRVTGAIYLLGYVAEMTLKTAYAQLNGATSGDLVRAYWPSLHNLHDLNVWFSAIERARLLKSLPVAGGAFVNLRTNVAVIARLWNVSIRYSEYIATQDELKIVYGAVEHLFENYDQLWR